MLEKIKEFIPYISSLATFLDVIKFVQRCGNYIIGNSKVRDFDAGFIFD